MARHMARAVVTLVRWDSSTGVPPQRDAIVRACEAGLDLFLATAREARPATQEELRRVAQLGILQARSSQSVEPILAAYRMAARIAWDEILRAWRGHPEATPEALMLVANYVFAALDQVAAEVTKTYLHAREQHMQRGTRAHARLFHALISDNFDSELELQRQALALNMPLAASGYIAVVCKLVLGNRDGERGGQTLAEVASAADVPRGAIVHATDPASRDFEVTGTRVNGEISVVVRDRTALRSALTACYPLSSARQRSDGRPPRWPAPSAVGPRQS